MNAPMQSAQRASALKFSAIAFAVVSAVLLTGCNTLERSTSLANPAVTPTVIAQQVCSNCHGVDGNAESPNFPNLAAQQEPYLITQLKGFKSHGRSDPAGFEYMWGVSKYLTDEQIAGLAAYYAKQKAKPTWQSRHTPSANADGKKIFEEGIAASSVPACKTCHGSEAQGMATFPRLAGQHSDYVVKQLMVFQRTDERPEGGVMKGIAHLLTHENMEAVAAYLETL